MILNDVFMQKLNGLDLSMENGVQIKQWFENFKEGML